MLNIDIASFPNLLELYYKKWIIHELCYELLLLLLIICI